MIAYLDGKPIIHNRVLILEVKGVGYQVHVNDQLLSWASKKQTCQLFIYTHVKEDALELYGFKTVAERNLFELVLGVSGVGPTIALSLVASGPEPLTTSVQEAKVSFFTSVPRVGKKLAQKIIIELRGKLGELKALDLGPTSQIEQDVIESLTAMGFSQDLVQDSLAKIDLESIGVEKAIKLIIKSLKK